MRNLERHELDDLNREQQDYEQTLKFEAWRQDSLGVIKECLEKDGDLEDAIVYIRGGDEYEPTYKETNELVIEAVKIFIAQEKNSEIVDYIEHDTTKGWKIVTDFLSKNI